MTEESTKKIMTFENAREVRKREYGREIKTLCQNQEALEAKATKTKTLYKSKKQIAKCNYCHQNGNWVKSCRKWIAEGKPAKPNQDDKFQRKDGVTGNMSLLALHEEAFSFEEGCYDWFVDNGASKHDTNNNNYFTDFEVFESPHGVTAANGKIFPAVGNGTLKIVTEVKGERQFQELKEVWLVSGISKNLFSVLATHDRNTNSKFESTSEEFWLQINNKVILYSTRNKSGGLYKVYMEVLITNNPVEVKIANTNYSILQLYHER
ncbi:hypothetical protein AVEN_68554-1 [Araneus ventricosus]|uniref:Retrovirus-related Pol polyprotein from transposon TNT 1-94-like beta-barrel domain-containing protein n=1 Tax=Araneus ventricosus TaxID=182803 RepID=A0A4Y2HCT1_ARAVE|nr:hypothetical protein AVEN_68554-1 [Araneus ventricosus]